MQGRHGRLIDGDPIHAGDVVNVDRICEACAMVVGVTSWTAEAWAKRKTTR